MNEMSFIFFKEQTGSRNMTQYREEKLRDLQVHVIMDKTEGVNGARQHLEAT